MEGEPVLLLDNDKATLYRCRKRKLLLTAITLKAQALKR